MLPCKRNRAPKRQNKDQETEQAESKAEGTQVPSRHPASKNSQSYWQSIWTTYCIKGGNLRQFLQNHKEPDELSKPGKLATSSG